MGWHWGHQPGRGHSSAKCHETPPRADGAVGAARATGAMGAVGEDAEGCAGPKAVVAMQRPRASPGVAPWGIGEDWGGTRGAALPPTHSSLSPPGPTLARCPWGQSPVPETPPCCGHGASLGRSRCQLCGIGVPAGRVESGMDAQASLPVLIGKKRDGGRLEEEEIQSFVRGVTDGTAQQGQIGGHMAGQGGEEEGGSRPWDMAGDAAEGTVGVTAQRRGGERGGGVGSTDPGVTSPGDPSPGDLAQGHGRGRHGGTHVGTWVGSPAAGGGQGGTAGRRGEP